MTESTSEGLLGIWAPAQCPFRVAYSLRALDDIRLALVDAFFSIPHGGVEIGGILLGRREGPRTTILDYAALDCEHAFGPSFTLSPKDLARLSVLLEEARKNASGLQPVGWFHSHTRSGIFLSEADLEIHKRFFPAPWQLALVLKPHTFQPARAGFFFREADGSFHSQASYLEFVLEPLPPQSVPVSAVPPPGAGSSARPDSPPVTRVIAVPASGAAGGDSSAGTVAANGHEPELAAHPPASQPPIPGPPASAPAVQPATPPPPVSAPDPEHGPSADLPAPHFRVLDPPRRWRVAPLLGLAACLAIGAIGFQTRQAWLPWLSRAPRMWPRAGAAPAKVPVVTSLGLTLADQGGDLNISWDHKAAAVRAATGGTLGISSGGGAPLETRLDATQLQTGSLTFKRETEKVDVILTVEGPQGELGRQSLGFLGKMPEQPAEDANSPAARKRDALAAEVERLKGEIRAQTARNREMQEALDQRAASAADFERLKSQLTAQIAHSRELDKTIRSKDDQIAKLRTDLSVQQSHNRVLAKSVDDLQLRLQQMKRLSNQNADPAKP
jgi:proteasome lid subunit RPN8/RPN11